MTPVSESIRLTEHPDSLVISYSFISKFSRIVLPFFAFAVPVGLLNYVWFSEKMGIFSNYSLFVPLCLVLDALITWLFLRCVVLCFPVKFGTDGTVQQGLRKWRFPGPPAVSYTKTTKRGLETYSLHLHYGRTLVSLPGGGPEASTMLAAIELNRWLASRVGGKPDTRPALEIDAANWPLRACVAIAMTTVLYQWLGGFNGYFENDQTPIGTWTISAILVFACLGIAAFGVRTIVAFKNEIITAQYDRIVELMVTAAITLSGCVLVAHAAQLFQMKMAQ